MIEFRVLGTIDVDGVSPSDARTLRSHPYWMATLACLCLSRTPGAGRRDALVDLLWPSADRGRGRTSLRVALHGLRRHLGRDAIVSDGPDLRIDRDVLDCDVLVFRDLVAERRHENALALYGGDLLHGLTLRNAPGFERWLSDRRVTLRREAADAAWTVSGAAERRGQWIAAVRHARHAVALSRGEEPAVRRLLRLLDRAGDGATALREYREFADRWRLELGVAPSAETRAVVEEIRAGRIVRGDPDEASDARAEPTEASDRGAEPTPATSGVRPQLRPDRWSDAGRILVLPFEIDGSDTGLEHLATGLAHDVIASLARVSGTIVVARPSREQTPTASGQDPVALGLSHQADVVLDTSVRVVADRYVFISRLIDARLGRPIWAEAYDGTKGDLLEIRRRMLRDVLHAAGVELSAAENERLARGQTTSAAAFELYLEARSRWTRRTAEEVEASIRLLEEALAIDPKFALAQAGLMDAYTVSHPAGGRRLSESAVRGRAAGRRALELDPELGEVHATLGLLRGFLDSDWEGAVSDLRRAIELSPGCSSAHHWLGAILTFAWRELDEGGRELEIARQLDPFSPAIRADIGLAHAHREDLDGARRILGEIMEDDPGFWRAPYFLGIVCFLAGEPDAGTAHFCRAWRLGAFGTPPDALRPATADSETWRDTLEGHLARLAASDLQRGMRAVEAALLSMLLGRPDEALDWLGGVSEYSSAAWIAEFFPVFAPLLGESSFGELLVDAGLERLVSRRGRHDRG